MVVGEWKCLPGCSFVGNCSFDCWGYGCCYLWNDQVLCIGQKGSSEECFEAHSVLLGFYGCYACPLHRWYVLNKSKTGLLFEWLLITDLQLRHLLHPL